ncbi:hypothetical protein IFM89_003808 [Coptis chinensis]|uniref:Uncharacterized protein n=1 Tax=Coptis chinensis TaxID=261450 RepID=A0A835GX63_9MAGN|nr:hypothetical protein IFM89_003808 [Coptis chinensis]
MVKRFREDPNGDESAGKWVRGTSTLPKVFDQPNGSKLELVWKGRQPVGPRKHPSLFSESLGVLMATSRRFDWTKKLGAPRCRRQKSGYGITLRINGNLMRPEGAHFGSIFRGEFRNKRRANRAKQIAKHLLWKNKFSQFEEIMSRRFGAPPSLGDLFVRTHTSSQRDDALDDQSREYIHKMKDLAGIDEHGTQLPLSDEIYREVMPPERHGRVSQLAEMQRVAQEKEEERRLEIEEIKRQAQEKDEQSDMK